MIERYLDQKAAALQTSDEMPMKSILLDGSDISDAEDIVRFPKPKKKANTVLCDEKTQLCLSLCL